MERHEIEAELDEVERDLAYIARRAHIAAENLRHVAGAANADARFPLAAYAQDIERIAFNAELTRTALAKTRAICRDAKPAQAAAEEGGAE